MNELASKLIRSPRKLHHHGLSEKERAQLYDQEVIKVQQLQSYALSFVFYMFRSMFSCKHASHAIQ